MIRMSSLAQTVRIVVRVHQVARAQLPLARGMLYWFYIGAFVVCLCVCVLCWLGVVSCVWVAFFGFVLIFFISFFSCIGRFCGRVVFERVLRSWCGV
jgi:hypothetical protein